METPTVLQPPALLERVFSKSWEHSFLSAGLPLLLTDLWVVNRACHSQSALCTLSSFPGSRYWLRWDSREGVREQGWCSPNNNYLFMHIYISPGRSPKNWDLAFLFFEFLSARIIPGTQLHAQYYFFRQIHHTRTYLRVFWCVQCCCWFSFSFLIFSLSIVSDENQYSIQELSKDYSRGKMIKNEFRTDGLNWDTFHKWQWIVSPWKF